jgi:hypothetical protein
LVSHFKSNEKQFLEKETIRLIPINECGDSEAKYFTVKGNLKL